MKIGILVSVGLIALALAGSGIAATVEASPPGGHGQLSGHDQPCKGHGMSGDHHDMMPYRMFEHLDLSKEQRDKIDAIREANATEFRDKARVLRDITREMHGYALSDDFAVDRARELATRRAGLQADLQVLRMAGFNEAWKVLTVEQKGKVSEWRARHEKRGDPMEHPMMPQHDMKGWHSDD